MGAVSGPKCGICVTSLGDSSIGCDSCNSEYHPTHVCLWLPDDIIINIIRKYGGKRNL